MRPVVSSDVMGNRNVDVVPVGAWVEPASGFAQPDAVVGFFLKHFPHSLALLPSSCLDLFEMYFYS